VGAQDTREHDLSIIIPAFNEERRLPRAITAVRGYLDARDLKVEVLLVENGSVDATPRIADEAAHADARFRAIHVPRRGKGLAVRTGMLQASGDVVMFCDADFSMPVEEADRLYTAVRGGMDVAIGSREAPGARRIGEPARRHLMGRVFNGLVNGLAVAGIRDTQCGFKAFRRDVARDLAGRQRLEGWAFDVELLFLSRRLGYSMREVPITWRYDASSRVHPVRDTISMLGELLTIRWNALTGKYR